MSSAAPLKIVSIAHAAVSHEAGRLRYYPLAERRDIDLHLVVPQRFHQFGRTLRADPVDPTGPQVHVLPTRLRHAGPMSWYLHFYPGLRRLLRETDPDVIHLWEEPWSIVALQALALRRRAALVLEVDQNILKRLPPPFEAIRRTVLAHTDHVLARSPEAADVVRARGYKGPVTAIAYGVDHTTFFPAPAPGHRDSAELRLGYVGRLVEEKGLDDALDAMARCVVPVHLAIMGEGPHEERLRARAAELGLANRVSFRSWGKPTDVADFIRGLDALILLTRTTRAVREQFGRVIVEAQACGKPVIGSTCGAIPNVIGKGGWTVPERDSAGLASLIREIAAAAPAERAQKSALAIENARSRFTYDAVASALASASRSAALGRSRGLLPEQPAARLAD